MKREIVELNLILRSKNEVKEKPAYTFTGGIEVVLKDGREYCFDFTETKWQECTKKKKHAEISVCQRWLDEEYVKESNEDMKLDEMMDIQFLKDNAKSIAVYFEVEAKDEAEYESEFEVVSCSFRAKDEEEEIDFTEITTLQ